MKKPIAPLFLFLYGIVLFLSACNKAEVAPGDKQSAAGTNATGRIAAAAATYSLNNWMGSLNGTAKLSQFTIPGTHDSGARYESFSGTAKCQNLTISEQLNAGIRFLDIRCRHIDNSFTIHHGAVYQKINFNDVVTACYAFLNSNPSECIIMSVKEEHTPENNTRSFEDTFDSYIAANPTKWSLAEANPVLNQVRGKIVLLRRFGAVRTPKGINATAWKDNTTFEIITTQAQLKVQDQYKVPDNAQKWNLMTTLFNEAKASTTDRIYINFASGYKPGTFGIPNITTVSNYINPKLTQYFSTSTSGRYGIVPMDFAEASRNDLLIRTNFATN